MIIPNISTERHQPSSGDKKNANESKRDRESKGKVAEARRDNGEKREGERERGKETKQRYRLGCRLSLFPIVSPGFGHFNFTFSFSLTLLSYPYLPLPYLLWKEFFGPDGIAFSRQIVGIFRQPSNGNRRQKLLRIL